MSLPYPPQDRLCLGTFDAERWAAQVCQFWDFVSVSKFLLKAILNSQFRVALWTDPVYYMHSFCGFKKISRVVSEPHRWMISRPAQQAHPESLLQKAGKRKPSDRRCAPIEAA